MSFVDLLVIAMYLVWTAAGMGVVLYTVVFSISTIVDLVREAKGF